MKKLIAVLFIIFTMISTAYAENKLNFDGKEYYLRLSEKVSSITDFIISIIRLEKIWITGLRWLLFTIP